MSIIAEHRLRTLSSSRRSRKLRRVTILAATLATLGCDSTGPSPNMTGLWAARFDFRPPNDSIFLVLTQDGPTVKGNGFLRQPANVPPGVPLYYYYITFPVEGVVSVGTANLGMPLEPQIMGPRSNP